MRIKLLPLATYLLLLLLPVPLLTDYLETGHLPRSLQETITEVLLTVVIGVTIAAISRQNAKLEKLSLTDHLTGIGNRRQFEIDLKREANRSERLGTAL